MQSSNDVFSLSAYEARLGTSTEFMINNGWLTMTRHGPNRSDMISSWSKFFWTDQIPVETNRNVLLIDGTSKESHSDV